MWDFPWGSRDDLLGCGMKHRMFLKDYMLEIRVFRLQHRESLLKNCVVEVHALRVRFGGVPDRDLGQGLFVFWYGVEGGFQFIIRKGG